MLCDVVEGPDIRNVRRGEALIMLITFRHPPDVVRMIQIRCRKKHPSRHSTLYNVRKLV